MIHSIEQVSILCRRHPEARQSHIARHRVEETTLGRGDGLRQPGEPRVQRGLILAPDEDENGSGPGVGHQLASDLGSEESRPSRNQRVRHGLR